NFLTDLFPRPDQILVNHRGRHTIIGIFFIELESKFAIRFQDIITDVIFSAPDLMVVHDAIEFELGESGDLAVGQFTNEHKQAVEDSVLCDSKEFGALDLGIRFDTVATIDNAAKVCLFFAGAFWCSVSVTLCGAASVIFEERSVRIITLDQSSARRVVLCDRQCQSATGLQREDALNQSFAEAGLTDDQSAIVILDGAGNNLRR